MLHMTKHSSGLATASYSRYSSDNQRETSIDDQERLQDRRAAFDELVLVERFSDMEISASVPMVQRPGGKALLAAARRGEFRVLLIESLDRCWRDIVDQEQNIRWLEFAGIRIIGASDGYDSLHEDREFSRVVRGGANQQYLRDLAKKTHRGLTGQISRGGHAGGISYGYRSIEAGRVQKLEIDEQQSKWVRWIFEQYAAGWSCQRIAAELNRQDVRSGRGGTWAVSAIYGSPAKGSGILNNEIYVGRYIWNRSKWVKHPTTHKRTRIDRPHDEWVIEDRPELRIVAEAVWLAVRERLDGGRLRNGASGKGARPKTLLGGMMKCGKCGAAMIAISDRAYGCAARKDRGRSVCIGTNVRRDIADRRMASVVREELLSPEAITQIRGMLARMLRRQKKEDATGQGATKAALAEVEAEISRLVDAVAATGHSDALLVRLTKSESRRALLMQQVEQKPIDQVNIDELMAIYRRLLMGIEESLSKDPETARPLLRDYFGEIVVEADGDETWATFTADPARLLLKAVGGSGIGCGGRI